MSASIAVLDDEARMVEIVSMLLRRDGHEVRGFTEPARLQDWVKKPNQDFGGQRALDVMLGGYLTDLFRVRAYLDAARG